MYTKNKLIFINQLFYSVIIVMGNKVQLIISTFTLICRIESSIVFNFYITRSKYTCGSKEL